MNGATTLFPHKLSRRVKRNFNLTPLKDAEQLCADTKYEHQKIPCLYSSCIYQHLCLQETNIPQVMIVIQMVKNALHLWKESIIPCPQYTANRIYPEPSRFSYTSQSNYVTIILVFAPYFDIKFPYHLFFLISGKIIFKNLFSASWIPLDLSTLIISIKTYLRISIFNQMFQDSNSSCIKCPYRLWILI